MELSDERYNPKNTEVLLIWKVRLLMLVIQVVRLKKLNGKWGLLLVVGALLGVKIQSQ